MIEIPMSGGAENAHQSQSIQLGDNYCELHINWVTRFECWTMDVLVDAVVVMAGIMLLPSAGLSTTYRAGIGSFAMTGDNPTLDNLGSSNKLVWFNG